MNPYEKYVLPHLLTCACSVKPVRYQRRKVVPRAHGRVLELGMGPGLNLPYYDSSRVTEVIGVDPSRELESKAAKAAREVSFQVSYQPTTAEEMQVEDASIDSLVLTYTACTIPNAVSALTACRRTLKPDAEVYFCEHGLAPDASVQKWQNRINPVWKVLAGGCNLNRPIPAILEQAGYSIAEMETMYLPSTPKFAGYNYWGTAKLA